MADPDGQRKSSSAISPVWIPSGDPATPEEATMTKDEMIRAYNRNAASWPALVFVYGIIVGTMVLSASAIT